ncbi:hypothetical protein GGF42_003612 [Coemansia sp. RSA 2424]|nr:hypothetical protein GGF42_003612 [Coemansia sp. RSA 2424]
MPVLLSVEQFELFTRSVGAALPFTLRNYQCYGDLLCELDLSMVARRWDKLGYDLLAPVFKVCTRLRVLDMSLCQTVLSNQFERLFTDSPRICASLTSLDISETTFSIDSMTQVLSKLPGITSLVLNETSADDTVLGVVSKSMPSLEWLEIDSCEAVTDVGIKAIFDGCPKLAYLSTRECWDILNTDLVEQINARGGWEDIDVPQVYEDNEYDDNDEYDGYDDGEFYEYNYDTEDPDFYMNIARQFQRNLDRGR